MYDKPIDLPLPQHCMTCGEPTPTPTMADRMRCDEKHAPHFEMEDSA